MRNKKQAPLLLMLGALPFAMNGLNVSAQSVAQVRRVEILNPQIDGILDSLVTRELSCPSRDTSLFWLVSSRMQRGSRVMEITMRESLSDSSKIVGCSFWHGRLVCFNGALTGDFLRLLDKHDQVLVTVRSTNPEPTDYPAWYYEMKGDRVHLLGAYPLHCP